MKRPLSIGDEDPKRPGYYFLGCARCVRHRYAQRRIVPRKARAFPLWKKLSTPPLKQLSLFDLT